MKQLNDREAIIPVDYNSLSDKQRDQIIDSLLLIEEKRDKKIKGRIAACGDQQKG